MNMTISELISQFPYTDLEPVPQMADIVRLKAARDHLNDFVQSKHLNGNIGFVTRDELAVQDVPRHLISQDVRSGLLQEQARLVTSWKLFRFLQETSHQIRGFDLTKKVLFDLDTLSTLSLRIHNIFRRKKRKLVYRSKEERDIDEFALGRVYDVPINLYDALKDGYPLLHAFVIKRIPRYIAENIDELLAKRNELHMTVLEKPLMINGLLLGLYPVVEVPEFCLYEDAQWWSQDEITRRENADLIVNSATKVLNERGGNVLVYDYGGGTGNAAEAILRNIYEFKEIETREMLKSRVKIVVRECNENQIRAGVARFRELNAESQYLGILKNVFFLQNDISQPLREEDEKRLLKYFGSSGEELRIEDFAVFGISSFNAGSLSKGLVDGMSREMLRQCWQAIVTDFSSPARRRKAFIKQLGVRAETYLRTVHGESTDKEKKTPLPAWLRILTAIAYRKQLKKYGLRLRTFSDYIEMISIAPGLISNMMTWPGGEIGHESGYIPDGKGGLNDPYLLTVADICGGDNDVSLGYKDYVGYFTLSFVGASNGLVRLAMVPGTYLGSVFIENPRNSPYARPR
jgi:hypothetical protein